MNHNFVTKCFPGESRKVHILGKRVFDIAIRYTCFFSFLYFDK